MVYDVYLDGDAPALISELESIGQVVQEDLEVPPLIAHDALNQIEVNSLVNHCFQLHPVLIGHELQYLERREYGRLEVEVLIRYGKLVVLEFGKVKEVIYQVLHHALAEFEPLEYAFRLFDFAFDLLEDGAVVSIF